MLGGGRAWARPPNPDANTNTDASEAPELVALEGRILEAGGSRAPVSGAVVMLVDAPADVRPGRAARIPLDPDAITWMLRAETDADGHFSLAEVPRGMVRVVVVAGGYDRLEQWAEIAEGRELLVYLRPEVGGAYRTEVAVERARMAEPDHVLDAQQVRHHAGGANDPLLAALNLPGAARSPGGLGLLSLRGGNPTQTGYYVDGHPVPRAFHVVPVASVISPPMVDRVELSPGNYGPGYGGWSGGLVEVFSRTGRRDGIHGQAHVDLFDVGMTLEAPVGPGSMNFGFRRSHVDGVIRAVEAASGPTGILLPSYWDYLGRVDIPVRESHRLSVRAIGAGDRLRGRGPDPVPGQSPNLFEFSASFHRFDLDYRVDDGPWRVLISPSVRLDSARIEQEYLIRRDANVISGRVEVANDLREWLTLEVGSDVVYERWRRRERRLQQFGGDIRDPDQLQVDERYSGQQLRAGLWLATAIRKGDWALIPSLRLNLLSYAGEQFLRLDPRVEVHGQVHQKLEWFAKLGLYSVPRVVTNAGSDTNLIVQDGEIFGGLADVPDYLIAYFDPGIQGEVRDGSAGAATTIQASTGVEATLPWELAVRATLFWREVLPTTIPVFLDDSTIEVETARRRGIGAELLLERSLGRKVDGWIGYTLLWARVRPQDRDWIPAVFDQRHNFVALVSFALPRNFRFGARFRVVSGNPQQTVLAGELVTDGLARYYRPVRGVRGTTYQPVFHQLDLRLDKRWVLRRVGVTAYLDVQNVYDRRYPEVLIYTADWSQSGALLGLPIYPSFGVQVDY